MSKSDQRSESNSLVNRLLEVDSSLKNLDPKAFITQVYKVCQTYGSPLTRIKLKVEAANIGEIINTIRLRKTDYVDVRKLNDEDMIYSIEILLPTVNEDNIGAVQKRIETSLSKHNAYSHGLESEVIFEPESDKNIFYLDENIYQLPGLTPEDLEGKEIYVSRKPATRARVKEVIEDAWYHNQELLNYLRDERILNCSLKKEEGEEKRNLALVTQKEDSFTCATLSSYIPSDGKTMSTLSNQWVVVDNLAYTLHIDDNKVSLSKLVGSKQQ